MGLKEMTRFESFIAKRPLLVKNAECGDIGVLKEFSNRVFIGIVDVAGHGRAAHQVAEKCEKFLEKNYEKDLVQLMKEFHEEIRGSRGAVACLARLNLETGELKYVGIGNVTIRKFGTSSVKTIPRSGIVGYSMPSPIEEVMQLNDGDVLVIHTDGIVGHFELADYPELLRDSARRVATHIIHQFAKPEDDAACIALRFGGGGTLSDDEVLG